MLELIKNEFVCVCFTLKLCESPFLMEILLASEFERIYSPLHPPNSMSILKPIFVLNRNTTKEWENFHSKRTHKMLNSLEN